jgi:gliding motility-associated-like protein
MQTPATYFLLLFVLLAATAGVWGQVGVNLVPNPSFEEYSECPEEFHITSWDGYPHGAWETVSPPNDWYNPTYASPDFFSTCFNSSNNGVGVPSNYYGYQNARTGDSYIGLVIENCINENCILDSLFHIREYIQAELSSETIAGHNYRVSCYVSLADNCGWASNGLGIYLSSTPITDNIETALYLEPQVLSDSIIVEKTKWVLIGSEVTLNEPVKYISIGGFSSLNDTNNVNIPQSGSLHYSYYYIDDVSLIEVEEVDTNANDSLFVDSQLTNIITPNGDGINDHFLPNLNFEYLIQIYNRWGSLVYSGENQGWAPTNNTPTGVYFFYIRTTSPNIPIQTRSGTLTLLR